MGVKSVFLDRDGVLNQSGVVDGKPYAPTRLEDFVMFPDAQKAVQDLKSAGYILVVVTNQPDVGNGKVEKAVVQSMNERLMEQLPLDAIKVCYHSQSAGCSCRKPRPGMLIEAAQEFDIDVSQSFMIGDRAGDIAAGKSAGCTTIFIDRGYRESEQPNESDFVVSSLGKAVEKILS